MTSFLLQFNRKSRELKVEEFEGRAGQRSALRRRLELEKRRTDRNIEIVSINADSLEDVKVTHSRYFTAAS